MNKQLILAGAAFALLGGVSLAQDAPSAGANGSAQQQQPANSSNSSASSNESRPTAGSQITQGTNNTASSTATTPQNLPASPNDIRAVDVSDPQTFANEATIGNMFEIQSSQLALKMSQNADVKAFAQSMIDDHGTAGDNMKTAAQAAGVTLPTELDQKHADLLKQLQGASGDQFDQLYIQAQTQAHIDAVGLFKGYSQNGQGVLKDFADKLLPTLEHHYEMVMKLQQQ